MDFNLPWFLEHGTASYTATVAGAMNDVQPALMLSFYPVSIPQARGQGFVVELFFKHP